MKTLHLIAYISLAIGYITLFTVIFWLVFPYKPFTVKTPMPVDKKVYQAGEQITYIVDYCKYMDLPATVYRNYVDTVIYNVLPVVTHNPTGCHETQPTTRVPNLPSGTYYIRTLFQYKVNPIRTVTVVSQTETFDIIFNDSTASGHLNEKE